MISKIKYKGLYALFFFILYGICAKAQEKTSWQFEFLPGVSWAAPMPLKIVQENQPNIQLLAFYDTYPLDLPIYYSYRLSRYKNNRGWEIELNHLKLVLSNKPDEIQRFNITHGYNLIWINRTWNFEGFVFRAGVGTVAAHPENTVRNKKLDEKQGLFNDGYYISAISAQLAMQKKFILHKYFYLSLEAKICGGYSKIPVVDGYAQVPALTGGLHAGLGVKFN